MNDYVNNPEFWENLYLTENAEWDLKTPTPIFVRIIKEKKIINGGKLLILGSGYGYDAVEAAKAGFDVTAADFSGSANLFAGNLAAKSSVNIEFISSDFFALKDKYSAHFDAVYDYVTFCAIEPGRRKEYAGLINSLLKPGGKLIALWFPVENRSGGPPFGIDLAATEKLFSTHLTLVSSSVEEDTIKPRKGREILQLYRKDD